MIYWKIIYFITFDAFGVNLLHSFFMPSCLAWNIPEPKNARLYLKQINVSMMSQTSDALWSWHTPLLPSSRSRTPPGFNCWTSVAPVFQYWSCCWVLILFHLSVESWLICYCFDSLMSRSPSRAPNSLYVYEPQQNLVQGLLKYETSLRPQ